jgi:5-methylcytosine-specific restriction endonuclease McrA
VAGRKPRGFAMTHPLILEGLIAHGSERSLEEAACVWAGCRTLRPECLTEKVIDRGWHHAEAWGIQGKRRERSPEGYGHCSNCGIELVPQTAASSAVRQGSGRCRKCERAYQKQYYQQNLGAYAAAAARRRAHNENAPGCSSVVQRKARAEVYGGLCYLCGRPGKAMDHVIPLSKGGSNWPANLRPICGSCNNTKRDSWPYDIEAHRQRRGYGKRVST